MIGVLGATGRVGALICDGLAEQGDAACAIVRRPSPGVPLPRRTADLHDGDALRTALHGVDRLLLLTPNSEEQAQLEANALAAAKHAGVGHIVKISGGAATLGPNGVTATAAAHWRSEQAIEASGLGYTFLRPSIYAQGMLETLAPLAAKLGFIPSPFGRAAVALLDVRDLAECAISALLEPPAEHSAWSVTGARALPVNVIAEQLGLRAVPVPPSATARALRRDGRSAHEVDHAVRMATYIAAGGASSVTDTVPRLTGHAARPLEQLIEETRGQFAPATALARTIARLTNKERT